MDHVNPLNDAAILDQPLTVSLITFSPSISVHVGNNNNQTKYKEFDEYVYVDDVRMFRRKSQVDGVDGGSGGGGDHNGRRTGRSLTWYCISHLSCGHRPSCH